MTQIILTDEQLRVFFAADDAVELLDGKGNRLAYISRLPSDAELAEARRRLESDGPWHTTSDVLRHLQSLNQG
jgi:hypothetical protein